MCACGYGSPHTAKGLLAAEFYATKIVCDFLLTIHHFIWLPTMGGVCCTNQNKVRNALHKLLLSVPVVEGKS